MAKVSYAARINQDLERLHECICAQAGPAVGKRAMRSIFDAIGMLERHPQIGRPVEEGLRELVISYGNTAYLALYRFDPFADQVRVLAIRHQRELDY